MNRENHTPPARTAPPESIEKQFVHCKCGDSYPANSYGAGFIDANGGVCENCRMYEPRISISAKAGQRLAKAKASSDAAIKHFQFFPTSGNELVVKKTRQELEIAALLLANELIANGHHEAEGD